MEESIVFIHVHHIYTVISTIDINHILTLYKRKCYIYSCTPYLHSNYLSKYEPQPKMNSHCQYCSGPDKVLTPHNIFTGKIDIDYSNKQLSKNLYLWKMLPKAH